MAEAPDPQQKALAELAPPADGEGAGAPRVTMVVEIVVIVILVGVVVVVILALLGPSIGNIYSNIVSGI